MPASPAAVLPAPDAPARAGEALVLVGNPNVGKSVVFGCLTRTYATVSNYPGTTVEVSRARLSPSAASGAPFAFVLDTPGTNTLTPSSEDERVTRDILLQGEHGGVLQVGDAKNLRRVLLLTTQLAEMGTPMALCLNMGDEAARRGIAIDHARLEEILGIPCIPTVAVRREGMRELGRALGTLRSSPYRVRHSEPIEAALARLEPILPPAPISARALGLMVLAGDETLAAWLHRGLDPAAMQRLRETVTEAERSYREPLRSVISRQRLAAVDRLVARVLRARPVQESSLARRLELATMHPLWGLPILLAVLWGAYAFVGLFGAGIAVDFIEETLFGGYLNPAVIGLFDRFVPVPFLRDLFVGEYGVVTMALTYALAIILPIVATFFIAFGLLEDSGYLPRLAVMVNRVFKWMGLNGKAVLPMVLGLGCDTMATLTTRILESRKERLIVILLLALGVPCSAQLGVIFAMLAGLPVWAAWVWGGTVAGVLFAVGFLASRILPGCGSDFVLELPPLRWPHPANIAHKTIGRIEWYLKEAAPLFVIGTLVLFAADRTGALGILERAARPVFVSVLALPEEMGRVFLVGFLRRDFGAAGLLRLGESGALDAVQTVVALVTMTLFIPCLANLLMIVKERGAWTAAAVSAFVFPFAILIGAALSWLLGMAGAGA